MLLRSTISFRESVRYDPDSSIRNFEVRVIQTSGSGCVEDLGHQPGDDQGRAMQRDTPKRHEPLVFLVSGELLGHQHGWG